MEFHVSIAAQTVSDGRAVDNSRETRLSESGQQPPLDQKASFQKEDLIRHVPESQMRDETERLMMLSEQASKEQASEKSLFTGMNMS